ncbi:hypothetical protein DENSPDRAFT_855571 [Dentipellis sp. KUC8613]|nr:hypothetical protein DENSPDRAFT_855571 [Dentipellis sp. KUC8613]
MEKRQASLQPSDSLLQLCLAKLNLLQRSNAGRNQVSGLFPKFSELRLKAHGPLLAGGQTLLHETRRAFRPCVSMQFCNEGFQRSEISFELVDTRSNIRHALICAALSGHQLLKSTSKSRNAWPIAFEADEAFFNGHSAFSQAVEAFLQGIDAPTIDREAVDALLQNSSSLVGRWKVVEACFQNRDARADVCQVIQALFHGRSPLCRASYLVTIS